jgi:hypothetical protein
VISLLGILAGLVAVAVGVVLIRRSAQRLRRAGAFGGIFWSSYRAYGGYRWRALRPLPSALLGVLLLGAGLTAAYIGIASFYADRLGIIQAR